MLNLFKLTDVTIIDSVGSSFTIKEKSFVILSSPLVIVAEHTTVISPLLGRAIVASPSEFTLIAGELHIQLIIVPFSPLSGTMIF
jgi:hypothetical protein